MIVDANILINAAMEELSHHDIASRWLTAALNGSTRVGIPWVSLMAFQRITSNARAFDKPLRVDEAWAFISDLLNADQVWIPSPGPRHAEILGRLLLGTQASGNLVTDCHIAALAIEYGTPVCSFDADFARFPEAIWFNPRDSWNR